MSAIHTPLKQLDMEELRKLAHLQGPCVTMQVPDSHPGAAGVPRTTQLRQLTQSAIESLGNLSRTPRTEFLASALRAFVETIDDAGGPGFTVFVAPGLETVFATPGVQASSVASRHFNVVPLLAAAAAPKSFYALGLSRKTIRLWHVTPRECEEVVLPHSVPASLAAAGAVDHPDHSIQNRSTVGSPGTRHGNGKVNSMRFGTVSEYDSEAEYVHHFFGLVAKGLKDVVQDAPLFLIGTRPDTLEYRRASHAADLFEAEWHANPAHCTVAEVEKEARIAAAKEAYNKAETALQHLPEIREKIAVDPASVFQAASEGRVHQLFLAEAARGQFPTGHNGASQAALSPGEDMLNASAVETLRTGGTVFVLPGETLSTGAPPESSVAAVLRF
jgi:hypothetical protein